MRVGPGGVSMADHMNALLGFSGSAGFPADLDGGFALDMTDLVHESKFDDEFPTMFPNDEDHPFPCNITHNYLGRLSSMFLLSFRSDAYIFGPKT